MTTSAQPEPGEARPGSVAVERLLRGASATFALGEAFGRTAPTGGGTVALHGHLGAGKTLFVQGLARGLELPSAGEVVSPTFLRMVVHDGAPSLVHVDAYRMQGEGDALELGLDEHVAGCAVVAVEWPDVIAGLLPDDRVAVELAHVDEGSRRVRVAGLGPAFVGVVRAGAGRVAVNRGACLGVLVSAFALWGLLAGPGVRTANGDDDAPGTASVLVEVRSGVTPLSDGRPLAGARVAALSAEQVGAGVTLDETFAPGAAGTGATDESGTVGLSAVAPETFVVVVAPGHATTVRSVATRSGRGDVRVPVASRPGASSVVEVVDPQGRPVEGALVTYTYRVDVDSARGEETSLATCRVRGRARANAAGLATVEGVPRGVDVVVHATASGWVASDERVLAAGSLGARLELGRGATVRGLARRIPGGADAVGAVLELGGVIAVADPGGRFVLQHVPTGRHELGVVGAAYVPAEARVVVVEEGDDRDVGVVSLMSTSTLRVTVRAIGGESLGGARVRVEWPRRADRPDAQSLDAVADDDGAVTLRGLRPAQGVRIEVHADGFARAVVAGVSLPPGEVVALPTVVLREGGSVAGRVVSGGALGVAGVVLTAHAPNDGAARSPLAECVTAVDGTFVMRGLPAQPVLLRARPPEGSPLLDGEFGPVTGTESRPAPIGPLTLRRGHDLDVSVRDAPTGTRIEVTDAAGDVIEHVVEPRSGGHAGEPEPGASAARDVTLRFGPLPPGPTHVRVVVPGAGDALSREVVVPAAFPVEFRLRPTGRVVFTLRGPAGEVVTRATLTVLGQETAAAGDAGGEGGDSAVAAPRRIERSGPDGGVRGRPAARSPPTRRSGGCRQRVEGRLRRVGDRRPR